MKTREGFVSNSSTSSFICHVCGEKFTGMDACPSEFDCLECPNGHIMCSEHLDSPLEPVFMDGCEHEFDRETIKFCPECGAAAKIEDDEFSMAVGNCPVCQFKIYAESEMAKYLEKTRGVNRDEVFAKIKEMNKRRKKLYDAEYITYVCGMFKLTDDILLAEIKDKFENFEAYSNFIYGSTDNY